jgi:hypothetical protein
VDGQQSSAPAPGSLLCIWESSLGLHALHWRSVRKATRVHAASRPAGPPAARGAAVFGPIISFWSIKMIVSAAK